MAQKKKEKDREAITIKNHARKQAKADARQARLIARTQSLIGQHVAIRVKDHLKPMVGTVIDVLRKGDDRYPVDAKRNVGCYLLVRTTFGDVKASRHRAKPVKDA